MFHEMEVHERVEIRGKRERIDADIGKPGWGGIRIVLFSSSKSLNVAKSKKIPTDSFQECRREGNGTKYSIE